MQLDTPGQQNVETSWPPRCSLCSVSKCSFFGSGTRNVGIRQAAFVSLGVSRVSWTVCTEKQLNLLYVLKPGDLGGGRVWQSKKLKYVSVSVSQRMSTRLPGLMESCFIEKQHSRQSYCVLSQMDALFQLTVQSICMFSCIPLQAFEMQKHK